jgi:DNA-binding NarL/FixJ family response regulator
MVNSSRRSAGASGSARSLAGRDDRANAMERGVFGQQAARVGPAAMGDARILEPPVWSRGRDISQSSRCLADETTGDESSNHGRTRVPRVRANASVEAERCEQRGPAWASALSPTEMEVASDAVAGLSNAAIARKRGRSPRTVANQLQSIYRKLGVSSRAEMTAYLFSVGRTSTGEPPHAASDHGVSLRRASTLSERERTIARLAACGKPNKLIAYELGLAQSTVATHLSAALRKLGLASRVEIIRLGSRLDPQTADHGTSPQDGRTAPDIEAR